MTLWPFCPIYLLFSFDQKKSLQNQSVYKDKYLKKKYKFALPLATE